MSEHSKKELLDALFNYATEGIILADERGEILIVNPAGEKMFDYDPGEIPGKNVDILVPDSVRGGHAKNRENYHKNPHSRPMGLGLDLFGKKKNGDLFPVEISLSTIKHRDQTLVVAFIIDISVRKQIEESVIEKQKELERVAAVLLATNEELEKKVSDRTKVLQEAIRELERSRNELSVALEKEKDLNDLKSRFISMASHEFRTPLTTILSSTSLIAEYNKPELEEKRNKHINRIKSSVNNLNDILSDFLSISKLEEGKVNAEFRVFDLKQLIDDVNNEMSVTAKPGQKLIYKHTGINSIFLDPKLLKNILLNLISNSIKFTDENKVITIFSHADDKLISLEVNDQGIGISEEDQKHLFERFYRGKNAFNIQGTGLGLHIIGSYVDLMKGYIILQSELNKGTTIKITFPNQVPN